MIASRSLQRHHRGGPLRVVDERRAEQPAAQHAEHHHQDHDERRQVDEEVVEASGRPRLAMMMLGGSPTRVAAPPMLEAITSAIRYGTGAQPQPLAHQERDRRDQQHGGDVVQQRGGDRGDHAPACTISRYGRPRARLAAQIAMYSKTPVCRRTETIIIMPEQQEDDVPVDAGVRRRRTPCPRR